MSVITSARPRKRRVADEVGGRRADGHDHRQRGGRGAEGEPERVERAGLPERLGQLGRRAVDEQGEQREREEEQARGQRAGQQRR